MAPFLVLLLVWSVAAKNCLTPECGGKMNAFMDTRDGVRGNCSFAEILQPQGVIIDTYPFTGCDDHTGASNGVPVSLFDYDMYGMFYMSGDGAYLYDFYIAYQETELWAKLPTSYNYTLGLAQWSGAVFWLTTSTLYYANSTSGLPPFSFNPVLTVSFSTNAAMTGNYHSTQAIYVVDGQTLYTIDISNPTQPKLSSQSLMGLPASVTVITMSLYVPSNASTPVPFLVSVTNTSDFSMYNIDPSSAMATWLTALPDTTKPPIAKTSTVMESEIFFCDQEHLFDVDIDYGMVLSNYAFNSQRLEGALQIHP